MGYAYSKHGIDPNTQERVDFARRYPLGLRDFVKMVVRHEQLIAMLRIEMKAAEKLHAMYSFEGNAPMALASRYDIDDCEKRIKIATDNFAKTQACNPRLAMSIRLEWAEEH